MSSPRVRIQAKAVWAGVDPKIIQSTIGHSSIVTTRGYRHARVEQAAAALGQIAGQLQLVPAIEA